MHLNLLGAISISKPSEHCKIENSERQRGRIKKKDTRRLVSNKKGGKMERPELNMIDLNEAIANVTSGREKKIITLSPGQWDKMLAETYTGGWLLLEIDQNEQPVRAYQRLTEA